MVWCCDGPQPITYEDIEREYNNLKNIKSPTTFGVQCIVSNKWLQVVQDGTITYTTVSSNATPYGFIITLRNGFTEKIVTANFNSTLRFFLTVDAANTLITTTDIYKAIPISQSSQYGCFKLGNYTFRHIKL